VTRHLCRLAQAAAIVAVCLAGVHSTVGAQGQPDKVPIVAVAGCLAEPADQTWMLTAATDPVPSIANAPSAKQPYTGPTRGKNSFRLIGVSEFDLPAHKGKTVLVKGLFIKAAPLSRINVTSVTPLSDTCAPAVR
jgi:hypothetical protein